MSTESTQQTDQALQDLLGLVPDHPVDNPPAGELSTTGDELAEQPSENPADPAGQDLAVTEVAPDQDSALTQSEDLVDRATLLMVQVENTKDDVKAATVDQWLADTVTGLDDFQEWSGFDGRTVELAASTRDREQHDWAPKALLAAVGQDDWVIAVRITGLAEQITAAARDLLADTDACDELNANSVIPEEVRSQVDQNLADVRAVAGPIAAQSMPWAAVTVEDARMQAYVRIRELRVEAETRNEPTPEQRLQNARSELASRQSAQAKERADALRRERQIAFAKAAAPYAILAVSLFGIWGGASLNDGSLEGTIGALGWQLWPLWTLIALFAMWILPGIYKGFDEVTFISIGKAIGALLLGLFMAAIGWIVLVIGVVVAAAVAVFSMTIGNVFGGK